MSDPGCRPAGRWCRLTRPHGPGFAASIDSPATGGALMAAWCAGGITAHRTSCLRALKTAWRQRQCPLVLSEALTCDACPGSPPADCIVAGSGAATAVFCLVAAAGGATARAFPANLQHQFQKRRCGFHPLPQPRLEKLSTAASHQV